MTLLQFMVMSFDNRDPLNLMHNFSFAECIRVNVM